MNYTGYMEAFCSEETLANFYNTLKEENRSFFDVQENQYLVLYLDKEVVDIYVKRQGKLVKVKYPTISSNYTGEIKPRNLQQHLLFDMLNNDDITVKLVTGRFGSGKSFSIIAAALAAIEAGKYKKIVWVRNNIDVKDTTPLGALPGDEYTKLLPFAMPLADHCGGVDGIRYLMEKQQLEIVHLGYLRGRDIRDSIILCSEAENLTKEHIQLILGRVGENSALFMDADLRQRDKATFEKSKGIETMIDCLKGNPLFGYVHLIRSERSATARLADLMD